MDTRLLKYFVTVYETKNITSAAELLYISQQTLSASIAKLEKEMHTKLFIRLSKGVEATKSGMYLYGEAQKILDIEAQTLQYLSSIHTIPVNLKVGCAYGVIHELSDKLLNTLELSARMLRPKYIELTDVECEHAVENGSVDLGFAIGPIDTTKFCALPIVSCPYCFIIHMSHPLARKNSLALRDLADEHFVILNQQFKANHIFSNLCQKHGLAPEYIFEAGEIAPIEDLVRKQYGIGIGTEFIIKDTLDPELCIRTLADVDYNWNVYLIWKKTAELSDVSKEFAGYITGSKIQ